LRQPSDGPVCAAVRIDPGASDVTEEPGGALAGGDDAKGERGMRQRMAGLLVLGLLATASAGLVAAEPGADEPRTERRAGHVFSAAGFWSLTEPGPDGTTYETQAAVWLPGKQGKNVRCFDFEVERTATETTATVSCDPGKGRGNLMARVELGTIVWEGHTGWGVDDCLDRHDLRKKPFFTCTVANPVAAGGD